MEFFLFFLLGCLLLCLFLGLLSLFQSFLDCLGYLRCDLLIAIVNDLNKQVLALLNRRIVIEHNFQHIADNSLMIDSKIELKPIKLVKLTLDKRQNPPLPHSSNQQINNQNLILLLDQHLLQYKLIILHDSIDMKLHIKFLQFFVLLEPDWRGVVFELELY